MNTNIEIKPEEIVKRNKIDLIKVVYSDVNDYKEFGTISKEMAIDILKQLKEFRERYEYKYPKFILHSNIGQFENCFNLLISGCTLSEIEEYYLSYLVKQKAKVKVF